MKSIRQASTKTFAKPTRGTAPDLNRVHLASSSAGSQISSVGAGARLLLQRRAGVAPLAHPPLLGAQRSLGNRSIQKQLNNLSARCGSIVDPLPNDLLSALITTGQETVQRDSSVPTPKEVGVAYSKAGPRYFAEENQGKKIRDRINSLGENGDQFLDQYGGKAQRRAQAEANKLNQQTF